MAAEITGASAADGRLRDDTRRACLDLDDRPDAARAGRVFVETHVAAWRAESGLADDVALVSAELLANARQHGTAPIGICVSGGPDRVRVEVTDSSSRLPIMPTPSTQNMTGRGLSLVAAVSSAWGVERQEDGSKTVWAELVPGGHEAVESFHADLGLDDWPDDEAEDRRFTVVLGDVPTDLLIEAKAHIDNLVREFTLAGAAGHNGDVEVPRPLANLIETVVNGFSDARDSIKRQALAAAARGEPRTRLVLRLHGNAADAGVAYLAALDEADEYSRAARLLTLETPADHRLFRQWYVEAVVTQLRQLAAGQEPDDIVPFEDVLVSEIRRLVSAQRVSERAARLQRVTAALARSRTPEDVAQVVLSEGVAALQASGGGMMLPADDGEHLAVPGVVGYGEELMGALREERVDAPLPAATALRTGAPVWLETPDERDRQFPALRGFEAATVAMCAVPLVVGDRTLGALRFSFTQRKLFDDDERAFVLALAALTAQTLQRTELYQTEREAALDLQRALLPDRLPHVPGWEIATYYSPAGQQEAGGDFYDVIPVANDRFVAIVGDVMGRGVEAAAAMAQIRSTMRAYAVDDPDPSSVFTRVDMFFDWLEVAQLVTAIYFLVDPASDTVHVASAGHLAPLFVDPAGSRIIPTLIGPPFGVGRLERPAVALTVPPGASLVALTDGLVERRGEDIDEGIRRIVDATHGCDEVSAQELLDCIISAAGDIGTTDDDVTVLVLRRIA